MLQLCTTCMNAFQISHLRFDFAKKGKKKKKERSLYYTNNFELHFIIIILHKLEMEYDFVRKDQKLPLLTGVKLYSTTLYQFPTDLLSPLFQIVG